jgi:hypothetical protein
MATQWMSGKSAAEFNTRQSFRDCLVLVKRFKVELKIQGLNRTVKLSIFPLNGASVPVA